jgi:hypothetical protein
MDGMTAHFLARLDAIRETQLHHGRLLEATAEAVHTLKAAPKNATGSTLPIIVGASQWAGGILALVCLLKGGDVQTVLAFVQKLF